ncbi:MAG: AEC family transporter [bacterium]
MSSVLWQMAGLIACGIVWRVTRPGGIDAREVRRVLTTVVYWLFLPALILEVIWTADIGASSLKLVFVADATVFATLGAMALTCRLCHLPSPVAGAMLLAAAFPNVTYMGLPVMESLYGKLGTSIAIQYDVLACTPLLFTVGILVAQRFGQSDNSARLSLVTGVLETPPFWATIVALLLNVFSVPQPEGLADWLSMLGSPVVPIMLFSVGLSLTASSLTRSRLPVLVPVVVVQLLLAPLFAWGVIQFLALPPDFSTALVLEAGMPSMVLGLVICDQFQLDTPLYAAAVTVTTAFSLISLEWWHTLLT